MTMHPILTTHRGPGPRRKNEWRLLIAVFLSGLVIFFAGCTGESECTSSAHCPPNFECVSAGGLFSSDNVCLPEGESPDVFEDPGADATDTSEDLPGCDDGAVSGEQTDIDCGGPNCPPCQEGMDCEEHSDCHSDFCSEGICASDCSANESRCDGECVDTESDDAHCGDCGNSCEDDEECVGGSCECATECCTDDDCSGFEICDGGLCTCLEDCCSGDDCASGEVCTNRRECTDSSEACEDACDCPSGLNCSGGGCSGTHAGPGPAQLCCNDPQCGTDNPCVELDGSESVCP